MANSNNKLRNYSFEQLKDFSDSLPVANIIYEYRNEKWSVLFFNEMMCECIGFGLEKCESVLSENFLGIFESNDLSSLQQLFDDLLTDDKVIGHECRIKSNKGICYTKMEANIIEKNDEHILVNAIFVDVTNLEEKRQEFISKKAEWGIRTNMMDTSKQYIFKYHFDTDEYEVNYKNDLSHYFFSRIQEPFTMENFLDPKFVDVDSLEELNSFFLNLKTGIPRGLVVFRAKDEYGIWQHYLMKFATVFDDKIEAIYSMIYLKIITNKRKISNDAKRFQDFVKVGVNDTLLNAEYNLTRNKFEYIEGNLPDEYTISEDISLEENVDIISEFVEQEDRNQFKNFLSCNRIVNAYKDGINRGYLDFQAKYNGKYKWIGIIGHILKDTYSSNIILWIQVKQIDRKKQSEILLTANAKTDELTGLYNRFAFKEKVTEKMKKSQEDLVSAFVFFDIRKFNTINEAFGHTYGDKVLRDIARSVRLLLRETDEIGRLNGTKFLVYMYKEPDIETVIKKLEFINFAVSRETQDSIELSVNMGVSIYGRDGKEFEELFEKAETVDWQLLFRQNYSEQEITFTTVLILLT